MKVSASSERVPVQLEDLEARHERGQLGDRVGAEVVARQVQLAQLLRRGRGRQRPHARAREPVLGQPQLRDPAEPRRAQQRLEARVADLVAAQVEPADLDEAGIVGEQARPGGFEPPTTKVEDLAGTKVVDVQHRGEARDEHGET